MGIVPATVTSVHLMQSVVFSMNFCQQLEGYRSTGDVKPQSVEQQINPSPLRDGK